MGANFSQVRSATAAQAHNSAWDTVVNNAVQSFPGRSKGSSGGAAPPAATPDTAAPLGAAGVASPISAAVAGIPAPVGGKRSLLG